MGVVVIPFDYEQLPDAQREAIVPICIPSADRHGNPIAPVWFDAVSKVQDQLRNLARYRLGDVRQVSELAEVTVHKLWERHGEDAGNLPGSRVLIRAMWEARDMAVGNSQWLIRHTVPLALGSLERDVYGNGLTDPARYDAVYERELLVQLVERRAMRDHREEYRHIFTMLRQGYGWDEIAAELHDPKPEALKNDSGDGSDRTFRKNLRKSPFIPEDICHNYWRTMKGESPQQQWERLQREYQEAVQDSYPNPKRQGCPGTDVLLDLASRSARHEDIEEDQQWKHVIHCAPCYREYLDLRESCRLGEEAGMHRESR